MVPSFSLKPDLPSCKGMKKVYMFGPGPMTKIATVPIVNLKKTSFLKKKVLGRLIWNLVCNS